MLQAGVPMLVYSTGFLDQDGNAARVAGKGLGLAGEKGDTARTMWRRLERLLDEPRFRDACRAMAECSDRYDDPVRLDAALRRCMKDGFMTPPGGG